MNLFTGLQKATDEDIQNVIQDLDTNTLLFIFSQINKQLDMRDNLLF